MKKFNLALALYFTSIVGALADQQLTPYAGQQQREIKALSADEIQSYLDGKGLGFAKTAELNHYPGPRHVLDQAEKLQLSDQQKELTSKIFNAMQSQAKRLGASYIQKERELDRLFATGEITDEMLRATLKAIGELQADIRRVHLQAHLEQKAVLSAEQVQRYDQLRGYVGNQGAPSSHDSHHH